MILARRIASDMGEAQAVEVLRLDMRRDEDGLDERRLVMAARKVEADRPPASPAIVAIPMAQGIDPLLLGPLKPIFPRSHILAMIDRLMTIAIPEVRSPTSYE
jgi:hypothetical protein